MSSWNKKHAHHKQPYYLRKRKCTPEEASARNKARFTAEFRRSIKTAITIKRDPKITVVKIFRDFPVTNGYRYPKTTSLLSYSFMPHQLNNRGFSRGSGNNVLEKDWEIQRRIFGNLRMGEKYMWDRWKRTKATPMTPFQYSFFWYQYTKNIISICQFIHC